MICIILIKCYLPFHSSQIFTDAKIKQNKQKNKKEKQRGVKVLTPAKECHPTASLISLVHTQGGKIQLYLKNILTEEQNVCSFYYLCTFEYLSFKNSV